MSARLSRRWAAVRAHENRAKPRCRMAKIQSYWAVRAFWCRFGAAWAGPRDRSREATNAEGETLRHEPEGGAEMQAVAHPPYHPLYKPEYHAIVLNRQNPKLRLAGGTRTRPSERRPFVSRTLLRRRRSRPPRIESVLERGPSCHRIVFETRRIAER